MNKNFIVLLLILFPYLSYSQSLEDVNKQATSMGVNSQSDILKELAKRGMSEADARRMATVYGLDYDEYISSYITNKSSTTTSTSMSVFPTASELTILSDTSTIEEIEEIEEEESIYFGYDIFLNNPFANKEYLVGNIDEGYILAPGDVLRIYVFGDNTYQSEVKIDLNGNILLPDIGMFFATGYTFSSLKSRLNDFLGKSFSGLIDTPQRSFLDVSLTQLRPVKVTVLGESNTPGPHLVGGFATVLSALYSAGGIKVTGSLRNINVFRNNRLLKIVDLYDYITKGSLDDDIRLMNNDVIFIPSRNSSIELIGAVKNPYIYELKSNEGIKQVLDYSGGLLPNASSIAVIQRIRPINERKSDDVYNRFLTSVDLSKALSDDKITHNVSRGETLWAISKKYNVTVQDIKNWNNLYSNSLSIGQNLQIINNNFKLIDGDIVTFQTISDKVLNSVTISGSVNQPGSYPFSKYSDLKNLITGAAQNILPRTYLGKVDIYKETITGSRSFKTFNLEEVLLDSINIQLEDQDQIFIYSLDSVQGEQTITISGFGIDESKIMFWSADLNLFDVIFSSTSFNESEFGSKFLGSRVDIKRYNNDEGLFSVIPVNLDNLIDNNEKFILQPKDEIVLYSNAIDSNIEPTITVFGYVKNADTYTLESGMTVENAILSAGGFSEFAKMGVVTVDRKNRTSPNKLSDRYEVPIDLGYLKGISSKPQNSFILMDYDIISVLKDFNIKDNISIDVIGEVNSPGPVTFEYISENIASIIKKVGGYTPNVSLEASYILRDSIPINFDFKNNSNITNSFLKDKDQIFIASTNEEITVDGAVNNSSKSIYVKNKGIKYYIKNSGGKIKKIAGTRYVIYPSGKSKKAGFLKNPRIYPGSKIFISYKTEKEKKENQFMDRFVQIFALLTGTLTTVVLAKQLTN